MESLIPVRDGQHPRQRGGFNKVRPARLQLFPAFVAHFGEGIERRWPACRSFGPGTGAFFNLPTEDEMNATRSTWLIIAIHEV